MIFQGTEHTTKWRHLTLNPVWGETFVFEVNDEDDNKSVCFEVWDHDELTADDFMGEARFNIQNLVVVNRSVSDELVLEPKPGQPKGERGSIKVNPNSALPLLLIFAGPGSCAGGVL